MQARTNVEIDESKKDFYKWIAKVDLPEDLKQTIIDVEEGRNLSKVYTDLDEMWKDLVEDE